MLTVGSVYYNAVLNRTQLDSAIAKLERDYKALYFKIKPVVDHKPLIDLNKHLDLKGEHFERLQNQLDTNPITPKVDLKEVDKLTKKLKDIKIASVDIGGQINTTVTHKVQVEIDRGERERKSSTITITQSVDRSAARIDSALNKLNKDLQSSAQKTTNAVLSLKPGLVSRVGRAVVGAGMAVGRAGLGIVGGSVSTVLKSVIQSTTDELAKQITDGVKRSDVDGKLGEAVDRLLGRIIAIGENSLSGIAEISVGAHGDNAIETMFNDLLYAIETIVDPKQFHERSAAVRKEYFMLSAKVAAGEMDVAGAAKEGLLKLQDVFRRQVANAIFRVAQVSAIPLRLNTEQQLAKAAVTIDKFAKNPRASERLLQKNSESRNLEEKDNVLITIGGFERKKGTASQQLTEMMRPFFNKKTAFVEIKNTSTDRYAGQPGSKAFDIAKTVASAIGMPLGDEMKSLLSNLEILLEHAFKGINPDATKAALVGHVIKTIDPTKKVNFAGFSGGGFPVEQAVAIMEFLGHKDVGGVGIGTPMLGLGNVAKNYKSVLGVTDEQAVYYRKDLLGLSDRILQLMTKKAEKDGGKAAQGMAMAKYSPFPVPDNVKLSENIGISHDVWSYLGDETSYQVMQSMLAGMKDRSSKFDWTELDKEVLERYKHLIASLGEILDPRLTVGKASEKIVRLGKGVRFLARKDADRQGGNTLDYIQHILDKEEKDRSEKEKRFLNGFISDGVEALVGLGNINQYASEFSNIKVNVDFDKVKEDYIKRKIDENPEIEASMQTLAGFLVDKLAEGITPDKIEEEIKNSFPDLSNIDLFSATSIYKNKKEGEKLNQENIASFLQKARYEADFAKDRNNLKLEIAMAVAKNNPQASRAIDMLTSAAPKKLKEFGASDEQISKLSKTQQLALAQLLTKRIDDDIKFLRGIDQYKTGNKSQIKTNYEFFNLDEPAKKLNEEMTGMIGYVMQPIREILKGTEFEDLAQNYADLWETIHDSLVKFVNEGKEVSKDILDYAYLMLASKDKFQAFTLEKPSSVKQGKPYKDLPTAKADTVKSSGRSTQPTLEEKRQLAALNKQILAHNKTATDNEKVKLFNIKDIQYLASGQNGKVFLEKNTNRVVKMQSDSTHPIDVALDAIDKMAQKQNNPALSAASQMLRWVKPPERNVAAGFPSEADNINKAAFKQFGEYAEPKQFEGFLILRKQDGKNLFDKIKENKNDVKKLAAQIVRIGRFLKEFQNAGLLHRDLHASNIFETDAGDLKAIDYGSLQEIPSSVEKRASETDAQAQERLRQEQTKAKREDLTRAIKHGHGLLQGAGIDIDLEAYATLLQAGYKNEAWLHENEAEALAEQVIQKKLNNSLNYQHPLTKKAAANKKFVYESPLPQEYAGVRKPLQKVTATKTIDQSLFLKQAETTNAILSEIDRTAKEILAALKNTKPSNNISSTGGLFGSPTNYPSINPPLGDLSSERNAFPSPWNYRSQEEYQKAVSEYSSAAKPRVKNETIIATELKTLDKFVSAIDKFAEAIDRFNDMGNSRGYEEPDIPFVNAELVKEGYLSRLLDAARRGDVKDFGGASLDALKSGGEASFKALVISAKRFYAVLQGLEKAAMLVPGAAPAKGIIKGVGLPLLAGGAVLGATGLSEEAIGIVYDLLHNALASGGADLVRSIGAEMTSALSGLPFEIGEKIATQLTQVIESVISTSVEALSSAGTTVATPLLEGIVGKGAIDVVTVGAKQIDKKLPALPAAKGSDISNKTAQAAIKGAATAQEFGRLLKAASDIAVNASQETIELTKRITESLRGADANLRLPGKKELKALPPAEIAEKVKKVEAYKESIINSALNAIRDLDAILAKLPKIDRTNSPAARLKGIVQQYIDRAQRFDPYEDLRKKGVNPEAIRTIDVQARRSDLPDIDPIASLKTLKQSAIDKKKELVGAPIKDREQLAKELLAAASKAQQAVAQIDKVLTEKGAKNRSVRDLIKSVKSEITKAGKEAQSQLQNLGIDIGGNFNAGIGKGLKSDIGAIVSAAELLANLPPSIVKKILKIQSPSKVGEYLGRMFGEGLRLGAISSMGGLYSSLQNMALSMLNVVKNVLGIRSPSEEFGYIGKMLIEGLKKGLNFAEINNLIKKEFEGISDRALIETKKAYQQGYLGLADSKKVGQRLQDETFKEHSPAIGETQVYKNLKYRWSGDDWKTEHGTGVNDLRKQAVIDLRKLGTKQRLAPDNEKKVVQELITQKEKALANLADVLSALQSQHLKKYNRVPVRKFLEVEQPDKVAPFEEIKTPQKEPSQDLSQVDKLRQEIKEIHQQLTDPNLATNERVNLKRLREYKTKMIRQLMQSQKTVAEPPKVEAPQNLSEIDKLRQDIKEIHQQLTDPNLATNERVNLKRLREYKTKMIRQLMQSQRPVAEPPKVEPLAPPQKIETPVTKKQKSFEVAIDSSVQPTSEVFQKAGQLIINGLKQGLDFTEIRKQLKQQFNFLTEETLNEVEQLSQKLTSLDQLDFNHIDHSTNPQKVANILQRRHEVHTNTDIPIPPTQTANSDEEPEKPKDRWEAWSTKARQFLQDFNQKLEPADGEFASGMVRGLKNAIAVVDDFIGHINLIGGAVKEIDRHLNTATKGMVNLGKGVQILVAGFVLLKAGEVIFQAIGNAIQNFIYQLPQAIKETIALAAQFESLKIGLSFSGIEDVDATLARLKENSNKVGASFLVSAQNLRSLSAATVNTSLQSQTPEILEGIQVGLVSRGATKEQQSNALLAITQLASKSRASLEEINQQLSEALPGSLQVAARAMGKTTPEFIKMVENGEILAEDLLPKLSRQFQLESAGGLIQVADSANAAFARLGNQVEEFQVNFGTGLLDPVKAVSAGLTLFLKTFNDNFSAAISITVALGAAISFVLIRAIWQFIAVTRAGVIAAKLFSTALQLAGVQATGAKGALLLFGKGLMAIGSAVLPIIAVQTALMGLYRIINAGSEDAKEGLKVIEQSAKAIATSADNPVQKPEQVGNIKGKGIGEVVAVFANQGKSQKRSTASDLLWKTTLWDDVNWAFENLDIQKDIQRTDEGIKTATSSIQTLQNVFGDTKKLAAFKTELSGIRETIDGLKINRALAASKGQTERVQTINSTIATLSQQEQKLIEGTFGGGVANIQAQIEGLEKLRSNLLGRKFSTDPVKYNEQLSGVESLLVKLKTYQEAYNDAIAVGASNYKEMIAAISKVNREVANLQSQFESNLRKSSNALKIGRTEQLKAAAKQIQETGFAASTNDRAYQRNLLADEIDKRQDLMSGFKVQIAEPVDKLNKITPAAEANLSKIFDTQSFSKDLFGGKLSAEAVSQMLQNYEQEKGEPLNRELEGILQTAQQYLSLRSQINETERQIIDQGLQLAESDAQLQRDRSQFLKDYRSFALDVNEFFISNQRWIFDFNRQISDLSISLGREARGVQEGYADLNRNLNRQLAQAQNELNSVSRRLEAVKIKISLNEDLTPGLDSYARQIAALFTQAQEEFNSLADEQGNIQLSRFDIEQQTLDIARQIRGLQEQQEDFERNRLRQLTDLSRQQSDFIRSQSRQWQEILYRYKELEKQAVELGMSMDSIAAQVANQGTSLIAAIAELTNRIAASVGSIPQLTVNPSTMGVLGRENKFVTPASGVFTSGYGMRIHPITGKEKHHAGIDIAGPMGSPISAAMSGKVTYAGWMQGYGNVVDVEHEGGYKTRYAHNKENLVSVGDIVKAGQAIAKMGSTGNSTGPHLHFEIHLNGKAINPIEFLENTPVTGKFTAGNPGRKTIDVPIATNYPSAIASSGTADKQRTTNSLLEKLVLAEAGGEGVLGMAAAARTVLNRSALIQSGKVTPSTYYAKSGSLEDVIKARSPITGKAQYSPLDDGNINKPFSQQQFNLAKEAIRLAQTTEEFTNQLKTYGLSQNQIKNVLNATGFRNRKTADDDPSQNYNLAVLGQHTFNADKFSAGLAATPSLTPITSPTFTYAPSEIKAPEVIPIRTQQGDIKSLDSVVPTLDSIDLSLPTTTASDLIGTQTEKYQKQQELTIEQLKSAYQKYANDFAAKAVQIKEDTLGITRNIRSQSEATQSLIAKGKGYLTLEEEISQARREANAEIRSQIESYQDQERAILKNIDGAASKVKQFKNAELPQPPNPSDAGAVAKYNEMVASQQALIKTYEDSVKAQKQQVYTIRENLLVLALEKQAILDKAAATKELEQVQRQLAIATKITTDYYDALADNSLNAYDKAAYKRESAILQQKNAFTAQMKEFTDSVRPGAIDRKTIDSLGAKGLLSKTEMELIAQQGYLSVEQFEKLKKTIEDINNIRLDSIATEFQNLVKEANTQGLEYMGRTRIDAYNVLADREASPFKKAEYTQQSALIEQELSYNSQLAELERQAQILPQVRDRYWELKEAIDVVNQTKLDAIAEQTNVFAEIANNSLNGLFVGVLESSRNGFKDIGDVFLNFIKSISDQLNQMVANYLTRLILTSIFKGALGGGFTGDALGGGGIALAKDGLHVGNFNDGGETIQDSKVKIQNFANGGNILALGMAVKAAMRREGANAVPIVAHKNEQVLTDRNGDAQFWRYLKKKGDWDYLKQNHPQKSVDNFASGGSVGGTDALGDLPSNRSRRGSKQQPNVVNINSTVHVSTPDANSFRRSASQIAAEQRLKTERASRNL